MRSLQRLSSMHHVNMGGWLLLLVPGLIYSGKGLFDIASPCMWGHHRSSHADEKSLSTSGDWLSDWRPALFVQAASNTGHKAVDQIRASGSLLANLEAGSDFEKTAATTVTASLEPPRRPPQQEIHKPPQEMKEERLSKEDNTHNGNRSAPRGTDNSTLDSELSEDNGDPRRDRRSLATSSSTLESGPSGLKAYTDSGQIDRLRRTSTSTLESGPSCLEEYSDLGQIDRLRPPSSSTVESGLAGNFANAIPQSSGPSRAARVALTLPTLLSMFFGIVIPLTFSQHSRQDSGALGLNVALLCALGLAACPNALPRRYPLRLRRFFSHVNNAVMLLLSLYEASPSAPEGERLRSVMGLLMGVCFIMSLFIHTVLLHHVRFGGRTLRRLREEIVEADPEWAAELISNEHTVTDTGPKQDGPGGRGNPGRNLPSARRRR